MKKITLLALSVFTMMLLIGVGCPSGVAAGVTIGINIVPPPPLAIPAPPPMFVIPRTYIYFAPEVEVDILFYHGYWYRPYQGHWYRAGSYNGKWVYIAPERVPRVLIDLPPNYRRVPPGHQHIPYGHVKKNWKAWEKDKYWEKHGGREWHGEKWEHDQGHGKGNGEKWEHDKNHGQGRGKGKHGD